MPPCSDGSSAKSEASLDAAEHGGSPVHPALICLNGG
jgi:hypothetical protein